MLPVKIVPKLLIRELNRLRGRIMTVERADLQIINIPSFLSIVPEFIDDHSTRLHIFRIDGQQKDVKPWKAVFDNGESTMVPEMKTGEKTLVHEHSFTSSLIKKSAKRLKIEKNFFQSTKNPQQVSEALKDKIECNKKMIGGGFKYFLLGDEDIERIYLEDSRIDDPEDLSSLAQRTRKASKLLRSGSFKADLFRYYMLYTRGGVWMDDKSILRRPMDDPVFGLDIYDGFIVYGNIIKGIEISFLASRKGNPLLRECLLRSLNNIEERFYGSTPLQVTGPVLAKEVFLPVLKHQGRTIEKDGYIMLKFNVNFPAIFEKHNLVWSQEDFTLKQVERILNPLHYSNLWGRGKLYVDNNEKREGIRFDTKFQINLGVLVPILILMFTILFFLAK